MRLKPTVAAVAGALAIGVGGGYLAGVTGTPQPASAQSPPAQTQPSADSMMGGDGASMMTQMMDAEHAKMMRDPAMRQMHQAMVREHKQMMRDPAMRRLEDRAMRKFPAMARMMREQMKG
jgi:1,4-dihydroxy-2-naphthoyl-CoA synthase